MLAQLAAVGAAALAVAPLALAVSPDDALRIAAKLKPSMERSYHQYGVHMAKVSCSLPARRHFRGAGESRAQDGQAWSATSERCTHVRTGKSAVCLT